MESSFKIVKMTNHAIICRPHIKPNSVISVTTLRPSSTHPHNRTLSQSVPVSTRHTQPYKVYYDMFGPQLHLSVRYCTYITYCCQWQ